MALAIICGILSLWITLPKRTRFVSLVYPTTYAKASVLQRFFAYVLVYKVQISLAKISVCLFLLRIFRASAFRYITYAMIALNIAVAVTWVFADIFHCIPVRLAWTGWEKAEPGKCINFITSTIVNAFVNIIIDASMVVMPMYEVAKLSLSTRKKLGVLLMFAMGGV